MAFNFSKGNRTIGDISFENDADTGIDFEADTVKLETGGAERLVVTNTGVGIGTNSPGTNLHVKGDDVRIRIDGDTDSHPGLELSENGTRKWIVYNDYTNDNLTFKTNSNTRMSIEQGGNVGIGTTNPSSMLEVNGNIKATGTINAKQRSIMSHKYTATSTSAAVFVRFNSAGSNTSGGVNNRFVAPADGKLLKVLIRTDGTPGNTEIAFCKITNGTSTFGAGSPSADVMLNISSADTTYIADFSGLSSPHDITFSEGNVLGIRVNPTNNHGNVDITTIWEFDWNS